MLNTIEILIHITLEKKTKRKLLLQKVVMTKKTKREGWEK